MAKYIEVKNNNGTITIDDTYARLVKTRTVTIDSGRTVFPEQDRYFISGYVDNKYILGSACVHYLNLQSNESFVAIRAKNAHTNVAVLGGFISAKRYQVTLMGSVTNTNTYESDYLLDVYGTVPSSGGTNSGLEVFNSSGTKIFDSDFYTMDVSGVYNVYSKGYENFPDAPNTYSIGSYGIENRAVAINSCINKPCHHPRSSAVLVVALYGVVFGSTIHLEKRVCEYTNYLYSGGGTTPHGYSHSGSGVVLNTENI